MSVERKRLINNLVTRLPIVRKKIHMSQEELGAKIGKSRQKVSDIERGTAPMGWDTYLAVCIVLEMHGAFKIEEEADRWYFSDKREWF